MFPTHRLRRMRRTENFRSLLREAEIRIGDLVQPIHVVPGSYKKEPRPSMPWCQQFSVDQIAQEVQSIADLGIGAVLLLGEPEQKDEEGSESYSPAGTVQRAIRAIKQSVPDMTVMTDVCLCSYTDHGHCGIFEAGQVQNDATIEILQRIAVSHAQSGADMVVPTDMMDGRVQAIRHALDEDYFEDVGIMAGSVIYASAFYGPDQRGHKEYQMDPANSDEALREVALDIEEGADIVMVQPASAYLDVIRRLKETFQMPVAAGHAGGEVSMIKAGAEKGWVDEQAAVLEILTGMRRAGADIIITYYAKDAARWLNDR